MEIGQAPGAKALASVEELKEFLEEGLQHEKLAAPLAEKISVACPALLDPILSVLAPETSALRICWGWAFNGTEASTQQDGRMEGHRPGGAPTTTTWVLCQRSTPQQYLRYLHIYYP